MPASTGPGRRSPAPRLRRARAAASWCGSAARSADGRVVSLDHGCGAHSEAITPAGSFGTIAPVVDELGYDLVDAPGISMAETVFESLDHG